ncbi:DUF3795 domain-containing protein [Candidatus Soleaferrea massiliensis]|uniref:DUF3795 domain-containing protein n=1 Tax=Candidatus Soleaferrea massiliensis TaxID=1470354 RepID=UPI00058FA44F|nr:DUF3795 domain-containing protein [Candidatus Soleaferrea massiliensis]
MKMPAHIDERMLAPCGMNCMVCYAHLKPKKACPGCLADDQDKPKSCRSCLIRECAQQRGLRLCAACGDFPCVSVKKLDKTYRKRYDVSLIACGRDALADLQGFLLKERERWSCQSCGGVLSLHDGWCSGCGQKPD